MKLILVVKRLANEEEGLVLIAVEVKGKKLGRVRLQRVVDASASNLITFVKTSIESGSIVQTDGWGGYNQLKTEGYTHNVIQETASVGRQVGFHFTARPICNILDISPCQFVKLVSLF